MVISQELVDAILEMKKEGYSRSEIIQAMSSQGYTPLEIEEHLARAERSSDEGLYYKESRPVPPPVSAPPPMPEPVEMERAEVNEELIESMVEDKVRNVTKNISEFEGWKEKTTTRLDKLEQSMDDLKERLDSLNKALISKIEKGEEQMMDVGTEMKAMQKVFKESIPELTKAISALKIGTKKKQV